MYQEIIVAAIGLVVILLVTSKIYGFFFNKNDQKGSCGCSQCGCSSDKARKIKSH